MIADNPRRILQQSADKTESYISATIDLGRMRQKRNDSRNFQQRRHDLYGPLSDPLTKGTPASRKEVTHK